jgi:hypothetical protein
VRYLISALRPTFAASHGDVPHAPAPSTATLVPRIKVLLRCSNDFGGLNKPRLFQAGSNSDLAENGFEIGLLGFVADDVRQGGFD